MSMGGGPGRPGGGVCAMAVDTSRQATATMMGDFMMASPFVIRMIVTQTILR
jgi:hypothetical protein